MPDNPPLILASSSPYKRRLMRRLGVDFTTCSPNIAEVRRPGESPATMTRRLATEKAQAIIEQVPYALVVGADQTAALDDRLFGKPQTRRRAIAQLQALQGRTHHLITAVALVGPDGDVHTSTSTYEMVMRPLTTAQIELYVDKDEPFDCAGSYKIEEAGIRLFEATRGDDPTAIEGLPLTRVWSLLIEAGYSSR